MNQENVILLEAMSNADGKVKRGNIGYFAFKRFFDILCSIIGLVFLIPLCVFVKIVYVLTGDFNSIFYSQYRIGKNGKLFKLYKFRSMVPNADAILMEMLKDPKIKEEYDLNKKLAKDPRITKVGKFLRKTSLDELPQVLNILKGDMAVIGNRPYLPREKEDMGMFYDKIIASKPGLSGIWQVSGRSNTTFLTRCKLESYYSDTMCFKKDVDIFFKTFKVVFSFIGAK